MNEKKTTPRLLLAAVVLGLCLVLGGPIAGLMNRLLGGIFNWNIPFKLVAMVAFLTVLADVLRFFFKLWSPESGRGKTAFTLLNSATRYIIGLVGLMWALAIMGVDVSALLAGAGVVALIIGFGAESLIADVITGIFMIFEHQYEVGDIIVVGDFRGTVTQIGIRTTCITDTGGNVQIINNSDIRNLINRSNDLSFAVCDIGIPYQGYLLRAESVLEKVLPTLPKTHPDLFGETPNYLGVQQLDINNDAIILRISAHVAEKNIYSGQRVLNRTLLLAFEEAGIPNPVAELKMVKE
jgi:small conductance mechanosensitive channel